MDERGRGSAAWAADGPAGLWPPRDGGDRVELGSPAPGASLAECAAAQAGVVGRAQCLSAGLTDRAVGWRVRTGRWRRLHRGVYLTEPGRRGADVDAAAALLRVQGEGPVADAALAGVTAAHLWGLVATAPPRPVLVVPVERRVEVPGLVVTRTTRFTELVEPLVYPWRTTAAATLLDATPRAGPDTVLAMLARGVQRGVLTPEGVVAELAARGRHRHRALVLEALGPVTVGAHSAAEVRFVRDVERAHGLPRGRRQVPGLHGPARVHDTLYAEHAVVVEVDGRLGHEGWAARGRDARRDRVAAAEGNVTLRVTWADVAGAPCRTAVEVGEVLRNRGWTGRPTRCRRRGCAVGARSP